MAYPPTVPVNTRSDATALTTNHPADHNAISNALTDIINELGTSPKGDFATVQAHLAAVCPIGAVLPYAGASAPSGWALCNGQAVSRATNADIFALIGTTYGVGDGSTTFNLPDLRSRFPTGLGTAGWSNVLGETGGNKDTTLVDHQHAGPSHQHTQQGTFGSTDPGNHTHGPGAGSEHMTRDTAYNTNQSVTNPVGPNAPAAVAFPATTAGAGAHTHNTTISGLTAASGTANTTGNTVGTGSATDTNLPPYITLNYIIRLT